MRSFTFGNKSSLDFGIVVEGIDRVVIASRRDTRITVPLVDGLVETGTPMTLDTRNITVRCGYIGENKSDLQTKVREIAYWLSESGRLSFSDEPDKYSLARILSSPPTEDKLRIRKFSLVFDVGPYDYGALVSESFQDSYTPQYKGTKRTPTRIEITNVGTTDAVGIQITVRERS